jgi:antitoxin component YwqK of YwqJK toxin-antitoxin module
VLVVQDEALFEFRPYGRGEKKLIYWATMTCKYTIYLFLNNFIMNSLIEKMTMTMKSYITFFSLLMLFTACSETQTAPSAAAPSIDLTKEGYELTTVPGSDASMAVKLDAEGKKVEEGLIKNGQKAGTWIQYHVGGEFPSKIVSYVDGKYNGPYMEFNERGQLALRATYQNNKLHGDWGKYSFGRPEILARYQNGELSGTYIEYDKKSGKIQKEISYKNGKQHGMYRFYNEKGEVTLEYEYKDGEKVGGGILDGKKG